MLRTLSASALLLALAATPAFATPVNVNTADAATIAKSLHGVGMAKAQAIVAYRKAHGAFHSTDELTRVKGIGPATVAHNRKDIRLGHVHAAAHAHHK